MEMQSTNIFKHPQKEAREQQNASEVNLQNLHMKTRYTKHQKSKQFDRSKHI